MLAISTRLSAKFYRTANSAEALVRFVLYILGLHLAVVRNDQISGPPHVAVIGSILKSLITFSLVFASPQPWLTV